MKRNTMFKSLLALVLVLALGSGTMLARQTLAQGPLGITGAASTLSASLGTGFTYQGRLSDASGPVDGTCDLTFKLYDEAGTGTPPTGGTLLGTVTKLSEEVSAGYFTVQLDFGDSAFAGDARWLEIAVDCGSGATTLSPRQELTAAPYARYAAVAPWSGLNGVPAGFADDTDNTDDTVTWSEISGIVGAGANQVAAGAHSHDDRYYTETELQTDDSASVHWGNLTNVPTGFADDTDDTDDTVTWSEISGIVGTGANQVAAGDHDHDGVYAPATHDHWGETWSGTGTGLTLSGGSVGLYVAGGSMGLAAEGSDYAVRGRSDSGYGVYGRSDSGYGVYAMGAGGDLQLYDGTIYANRLSDSDLALHSNDYVDVHLDDDSNSTSQFRVLNDANTAVFTVDESGDIASTADTEIAISPLNMVAYYASNDVELRPMSGFMEMRPPGVCNPSILLPVDLPSVLFGTATKLKSVRICYKCDTSVSYINLTRVRYVTDSGGYTELISDGTDRTSTTWDCYTLTDATPDEIQGSLYIEFGPKFTAAGDGHDIRIGRITLTLTE